MNAGALKETRYLEKHGRPLLPFDRFQRETFDFQEQDPAVHLDSLQKFLQISKHLIPPVAALTSPILRHPDLRPSNMFVSDNLEITALIDWQHSTALPAFLSAGVPDFLGRGPQPSHTAEITNGSEGKSDSERLHLLHQRHLYDTYLAMTEHHNAPHFQALAYPFSIGRQKIHRLSGDPWHGDNIPLRSSLIFVEQNWRQISADPETPCPISFAEDEVREILRLDDAEQQGVQQLEEFKSTIGLGPQGWVTNEDYDTAMEAIARMKELSLEQAESDDELIAIRDHWVFDDMDEEEYD